MANKNFYRVFVNDTPMGKYRACSEFGARQAVARDAGYNPKDPEYWDLVEDVRAVPLDPDDPETYTRDFDIYDNGD